jgi:DNA-directed RNA polymerase II subunit RPB3
MKPSITRSRKEGDAFHFTLSNVNVSVANAIRRTILSDIPTVVFRTFPHEHSDCTIAENVSRLNSQIIEHRLSCIPIHLKQVDKDLIKDYFLEVSVENITDTMLYVTTEDFKVKRKDGAKVTDERFKSENLFPADPYTGHFIDFVRLRPKVSDQIPGDKISLTCDFSIGTAKENGVYNVVYTCSYACTVDDEGINKELAKKKQQWADEGKTEAEIEFEKKNWLLLDSKRIVLPNSFDFVVQSVGVFDNDDIVQKAIKILVNKLNHIASELENDRVAIQGSKTTLEHGFDITLANEDYTIGKAFEYILFEKYFAIKEPVLSFVGFTKLHPHDKDGLLRLGFTSESDKLIAKQVMQDGIQDLIQIFEGIGARLS